MPNDFEEKLEAEAASWRTENAPKGLATCPNCRTRKHNPAAGAPGSDYWDCTAAPLLPVFAIHGHSARHAVNLKLFDPASPYAEHLNRQSCPLFEERL